MTPEIENTVRKIMAREIEIKMLERELDGIIISKDIVKEILKEITE